MQRVVSSLPIEVCGECTKTEKRCDCPAGVSFCRPLVDLRDVVADREGVRS